MCLAISARINKIEGTAAFADFGGVSKKISLGILSGVQVGDYVLVHAGFAIGKVKKEDAEDNLQALKELKDTLSE